VSYSILLVEDDPNLVQLLTRIVTEEGYESTCCTSLEAGRQAALSKHFDVVILDWMLPDGDGIALCTELRERGVQTPILMLTARGETPDRVKGLRSGADDYLVKPFDVEELLLRISALLRRATSATTLNAGDLQIDRLARTARIGEQPLDLTSKELELLVTLAMHPGEVQSRSHILQSVWSLAFDPGSGVLDVHVSRLRDKLGPHAWMVETVRGAGLRLRTRQ
jgi:DNA-binding response OmpR family regulator